MPELLNGLVGISRSGALFPRGTLVVRIEQRGSIYFAIGTDPYPVGSGVIDRVVDCPAWVQGWGNVPGVPVFALSQKQPLTGSDKENHGSLHREHTP